MKDDQLILDEEQWRRMRRELGRHHRLSGSVQLIIEDAMTWGEATAEAGEYDLDAEDVAYLFALRRQLWD